jgi:hypothetical protein
MIGRKQTNTAEYKKLTELEWLFAKALKKGGDTQTARFQSALSDMGEVNKNGETVDFDRAEINENGNKETLLPNDGENGNIQFAINDGVVEIRLDSEYQKAIDNAKTANEQRKIAFDYIKDNLKGVYIANDNREINIQNVTAKKITHNAPVTKLRMVENLAEMVEAGELQGVTPTPNHPKFREFVYYNTDIKFITDNEVLEYSARLNVGVRANGESVLYDINPYSKKSSALPDNGRSTLTEVKQPTKQSETNSTPSIRNSLSNSQQNLEKNAKGENVNDSDIIYPIVLLIAKKNRGYSNP